MKEKKKPSTGSRIDWPNQIMNFFGVVIGVLFAFSLNHWNESRKAEQKTVIALQNIKKEIENNLNNLKGSASTNQRQEDFLNLYLDNVNEDMEPLINNADSLESLFKDYMDIYNPKNNNASLEFDIYALSAVAWETAVQAQLLSELDYQLAYVIQEHYSVQEKLDHIDDAIIEEIRKTNNDRASMERFRAAVRIGNDIAATLKDKTSKEALEQINLFLKDH